MAGLDSHACTTTKRDDHDGDLEQAGGMVRVRSRAGEPLMSARPRPTRWSPDAE